MRRMLPTLILTALLAPTSARAQSSIDLSTLPAEIKTLKWQSVDLAKVPALQRCQGLLLLNDVLDEIGAQLTAEADMMSAYIDSKSMGPEFAQQAPVTDAPSLTFENAQEIAVALLQGPMAQSSYSTQLAGSSADVLTAYEHLYTSTCQSKWGAIANNQLRVRAMSRFLQAQGQVADYQAWVPGEVQRESQQHAANVAAKHAAEAKEEAQRNQKLNEAIQRHNQQQQQLATQQEAARSAQQAMSYAQQQQNQSVQPGAVVAPGYGYPNSYWGGWGALAPGSWYRDGAYLGNAAIRTDGRMNAWHGGGVRR